MVPRDRIELSSDPYQGPVLPLNYIGKISGVHDWNRTNDLQLRRLLLYPTELRGQKDYLKVSSLFSRIN